MHCRYFLTILIAFVLVPAPALAAVQVSELMYDYPGTEGESVHDWVEAYNAGSTPVDLAAADFRLFVKDSGHLVASYNGSGTVLLPGAAAVIANNPAQFLQDFPAFSGRLLDSSFSLSGTEQTIGFRHSDGTLEDSVVYSAALGGSDDGNSLQRSGSAFIAAAPTPGSYSGSGSSNSSSAGSNQSLPEEPAAAEPLTQTQVNPAASGAVPAISAHIEAGAVSMVGGGEFFSGRVLGSAGAPLASARYIWNFGDGSTAEGQRVFHAYSYPGEYDVLLSVGYNYSSATARQVVQAVAAQVALAAEGDGSLTVANKSGEDLDIGLWSLAQASSTFVVPEGTVVLRGKGVRFAPAVLRFAGDVSATLLYPNGALAASAAPGAFSPLRGQVVELAAAPGALKKSSGLLSAPQPSAQQQEPTVNGALSAAAAVAAAPDKVAWSYLWALAAVIALGALGAYYAHKPSAAETPASAAEFDIE